MARTTFKEDRCKGCGLCMEVCPKKIIEFDTKLNVKGYHPACIKEENMSKCIACASCAKMCPDVVIKVEK
jgi:2-oxoglutarate ferredoxin oxidoreductase subunit delta